MPSILVVDDDVPSQEFVSEFLEIKGYQVLKAGSAEEAFDRISRQQPDLVLMDILLPGLNGIDATLKLKNDPRTRTIKVIATTAMAMKGDEEQIFKGGFADYLVKPLDISSLLTSIERCLGAEATGFPPEMEAYESAGPVELDELPGCDATASKIRVYIVEDESLIRESLKAMLDLEEDIEVVGEAGEAEQAIKDLESLDVDVVLMDIRLPGLDGIEAIRFLKDNCTATAFVAITSYGDEYFRDAIEAGASSYVVKSSSRQQLVNSTRLASQGQGAIDSLLTTSLMQDLGELKRKLGATVLTPRQVEIMKMVANGTRYNEIAEALLINERTVRRDMKDIFNRLDVRDSAHAVAEAYKQRII